MEGLQKLVLTGRNKPVRVERKKWNTYSLNGGYIK